MSISGGVGREALTEEMEPFETCPLGAAPPLWRYERGCGGAREGRVATAGETDRAFIADLQVPLSEQLADVPRFIGSDGTMLFFHKVTPHVGPEYAPSMEYGFSDEAFAFYFSGRHASLWRKPIQLDPTANAAQAMLWERGRTYFSTDPPAPPMPRLHPRLRERLYFALGEAVAARITLGEDDLPRLADPQFGQEMRFGDELRHISQPPMSVGLPFCQLGFWPGFEWRGLQLSARRPQQTRRTPFERLFGRLRGR